MPESGNAATGPKAPLADLLRRRPPGSGVDRGRGGGLSRGWDAIRLIVHAEDPFLPWVSEVSSGIYGVVEAAAPAVRPDIYVEHLDLARFPELGHSGARAEWLREKYAHQKIDAILVVTKGGLDFLYPLAAELWPDVPIVVLHHRGVRAEDGTVRERREAPERLTRDPA